MANSTTSTLGGLLEVLPAQVYAQFRQQSALYTAVMSQDSVGANTVRFNYQSAPVSASLLAESSDLTAQAITIGARDVTLGTYAIGTRLTELANVSPQAMDAVAATLAASVAKKIDYLITAQVTNFTPTVGTGSVAFSAAKFYEAAAKLDDSGYVGQKVAILTPYQIKEIQEDIVAVPSMQQQYVMSNGFVGRLWGVDIYQTPNRLKSDDLVYEYGMMFIKEAGIGLGYANPIIRVKYAENILGVGYDIAAHALIGVSYLNAGAGVQLLSLIPS